MFVLKGGEAPEEEPETGPEGPEPPPPPLRHSPEPPSRDTLERVQLRDAAALATFFDRYFDWLYGLVYRLLGNRASAEDAVQDVFLKVHRGADSLDPARDPAPWLRTIAHNVCRDLWRSGAYRMARTAATLEDLPLLDPAAASTGLDPEREILAAERERMVQSALGRLPESLRVPVVLHDYEGLSHEEAAGVLGINPAAARKRYSRALSALAAILKDRLQ